MSTKGGPLSTEKTGITAYTRLATSRTFGPRLRPGGPDRKPPRRDMAHGRLSGRRTGFANAGAAQLGTSHAEGRPFGAYKRPPCAREAGLGLTATRP